MKMFPMLSAFSLYAMLFACGVDESSSEMKASVAVPASALTLLKGSTLCSSGTPPRFNFDSSVTSGRANFVATAWNIKHSSFPCDIRTEVALNRGYKLRVKSLHVNGTRKVTGGAKGSLNFKGGVSAIGTYSLKMDVNSSTPTPFTKAQTLSTETWTACSKVNGTKHTIIMMPTMTSTNPAGSTFETVLSEVRVMLEVESCVP